MLTIDIDTARRFIPGKQGLWLDDKTLGKDDVFVEALACGFMRFVKFLSAERVDAKAIREPLLRQYMSK